MERLDKLVSSQGGVSRKQARELIMRGAVEVDGAVVRLIDRKTDPEKEHVTVSGQPLEYHKFLYIMMNKPAGFVSATRDRDERTVLELLPPDMRRAGLFPAGRLDKDTEGLMIITDDGVFGHSLTAPGKTVYKTYVAQLDAPVTADMVGRFADGLTIDGGEVCRPAVLEPMEGSSARVKICEGKFHQVKRMFAACGLHVEHLRRVAIGALPLDESLAPGECRLITEDERKALLRNG